MYIINFQSSQNESQITYNALEVFTEEELDAIHIGVSKIDFVEATTLTDRRLAEHVTEDLELDESLPEIRRSHIKWITPCEEWLWLYERLVNLIEEANASLWRFNLVTAPEAIQYTEYWESENGHYDWHQDIGPGVGSLRKISLTIQLSNPDEYEGGDLEIWCGGNSVFKAEKQRGLACVFPSYMMHRVTPVTKGCRKSLVFWVGGTHYS